MTGLEEISSEIRENIALFFNEFHINLLDIHTLESSDIFQTDLREIFGFLKRQGDKDKLRKYVEENEAFRNMKEDAFDVVCTYSESWKLAIKKEEYRTKGGLNMCTALKEWAEEERAAGREDMNELNRKLVADKRIDDLIRSLQDSEFQKKLLIEYTK